MSTKSWVGVQQNPVTKNNNYNYCKKEIDYITDGLSNNISINKVTILSKCRFMGLIGAIVH